MHSTSVNKIVEVLEKLKLISDEYKKDSLSKIKMDLFLYPKGIEVENIPNISSLAEHSINPQLLGNFDLGFLTLSNSYVDIYNNEVFKLDESIMFRQLRNFMENPTALKERLKYCIDYGIPYKDKNNLIFKEVGFCTESGLYLRSMVLSELPKYGLNDVQKNIFRKVCGVLQTRTYEAMEEKLPITDNLAENIIDIVKSDPSLTEDDVEYVVKELVKVLPYLNIITQKDNNNLHDECNSSYPRNGRR